MIERQRDTKVDRGMDRQMDREGERWTLGRIDGQGQEMQLQVTKAAFQPSKQLDAAMWAVLKPESTWRMGDCVRDSRKLRQTKTLVSGTDRQTRGDEEQITAASECPRAPCEDI